MVANPIPQAFASPERRTAPRTLTDCPARLQTPGGDWRGRLWDLSETGARIQVDGPPAQGVLALLSWHTHELFCRVMWSEQDMCGVVFERPIARSLVLETIGEIEPEPAREMAPAASVSKIPVGRKRMRLV